MIRRFFLICTTVAIAFHCGTSSGQEKSKSRVDGDAVKVTPDKAQDHVGQEVVVEMVVRSWKKADSSERYFLDSEKDYRNSDNLAVVIPYETASAFEKIGVKDIIAHFSEKSIRVTGKVVRSSDQTRIFVNNPKQIVVLTEPVK